MTTWTHKLGKSKKELGIVTPKMRDSKEILMRKKQHLEDQVEKIQDKKKKKPLLFEIKQLEKLLE